MGVEVAPSRRRVTGKEEGIIRTRRVLTPDQEEAENSGDFSCRYYNDWHFPAGLWFPSRMIQELDDLCDEFVLRYALGAVFIARYWYNIYHF